MVDTEKIRVLLKKQEEERERATQAILKSSGLKKIIVSGPGTGKTYIFQKILEEKKGNCLIITFINNLANKLKEDLGELGRSCTFHSLCKGKFHEISFTELAKDFILYANLERIIESDINHIYKKTVKYNNIFQELDYKNENLDFYLKRGNYYNAVSFNDMVFRVLNYYRKNITEIPRYEIILVDEYQDFNKLEVEFINLLSLINPILIVGDDDQALYSKKNSSPNFIRGKMKSSDFESFQLPYCNRCTYIIVKSISDIITKAKQYGKLEGRISKVFKCYLPDKLEDSRKYPKLINVHCSVQSNRVPYVSRFIEKEINSIPYEEIIDVNEKGDYTILITGPKRYLQQIFNHLKTKTKHIIDFEDSKLIKGSKDLIDAYRLLVNDFSSNLGWRILLENIPDKSLKLDNLIKETIEDRDIKIIDRVSKGYKDGVYEILRVFDDIKNDNEVSKEQEKNVESIFSIKFEDLKKELDNEEIKESKKPSNISIKLSTYVGCKGLSAGYVFILGLNEGILPINNNNPKDFEICSFIVTLTRTIKKCYLISTIMFGGQYQGEKSIFLEWIDKKRMDFKQVNRMYW